MSEARSASTTGTTSLPAQRTLPDRQPRPAVGSVSPMVTAVLPPSIGRDIGCGVTAVRLPFGASVVTGRRTTLATLRSALTAAFPPAIAPDSFEASADHARQLEMQAAAIGFDPGALQSGWLAELGTLGGATHFVELALGDDDVWLAVHSGSGTIGERIADRHRAIAHQMNERYSGGQPDPEQSYLIEGTEPFQDFVQQASWAQRLAVANRLLLTEQALDVVRDWLPGADGFEVPPDDRIDSPHNFLRREIHFGRPTWVARRNAIDSHRGVRGVMPAPSGRDRYIVEGQGDRVSYCSLVHRPFLPAEPESDVQAPARSLRVIHVLRPLLTVAGGR